LERESRALIWALLREKRSGGWSDRGDTSCDSKNNEVSAKKEDISRKNGATRTQIDSLETSEYRGLDRPKALRITHRRRPGY